MSAQAPKRWSSQLSLSHPSLAASWISQHKMEAYLCLPSSACTQPPLPCVSRATAPTEICLPLPCEAPLPVLSRLCHITLSPPSVALLQNGHLQQCLETVRKEFIIFNREK